MITIHHIFNSSLVSGPETLVLPNLQDLPSSTQIKFTIILLQETRLPVGSRRVVDYVKSLGHHAHEIPVRSRFDLKAILSLYRYWKQTKPAIVHAHGAKASLFALLAKTFLAFNHQPTMITTHHGVRVNDHSRKLFFFEIVYERLVIPFFNLCLTVCSTDKDLLVKRGVSADKIQVHLNGVDRTLITRDARDAMQKVVRKNWKESYPTTNFEGFLIGVVGRLSTEKQHRRVLEALSLLKERAPKLNFKLLCFGTGHLADELRHESAQLNIADQVYWLGYRRNISEEICGLDLLLSLSSAEGLPINLVEAGWSGTPIIAQGVDGICDLIETGKSGILLNPPASPETVVNAILAAANERETALAMGSALQERVKANFSKYSWVQNLEKIYSQFVPLNRA